MNMPFRKVKISCLIILSFGQFLSRERCVFKGLSIFPKLRVCVAL